MAKKLYTFFLSMFVCTLGFGQNLVNNPGFENITGNCSFAGYSSLVSWYNPDPIDSCSTPDWFATCVTSPFTQAPNSQMGYQQPHGGNAYAGFISYDQSSASYREYAEGSLSAPLVATHKYDVKMYVSLANSSHFSVNHLGVYFSNAQVTTTAYNCPELYPLAYTPQIDSTFTLTDTTNWTMLTWKYTATGGEQFFTIGNFHNDAGTTATAVPHGLSFTPFAYYFVDDVSIVEDTTSAVDTTIDTTEAVYNINYKNAALQVYPVPANGDVTIEHIAGQTITDISIINSLGETVYHKNVNAAKETINVNTLATGLYMVRARTASGVLVRRLDIRH